jgi:hypothetical protein
MVFEFLCISLFFLLLWKKYRRRAFDRKLSFISLLLASTYFLFNLEFLGYDTKLIQFIIDGIIAIILGYYFIKSMLTEIKNTKEN